MNSFASLVLQVGMRPWGDLKPSHRIAVFDVIDAPTPLTGSQQAPGTLGSQEVLKITHVVSQTDMVAFLLFQAQEGNLGCVVCARVCDAAACVASAC
jgi:hypothetical protein